ncbi:ABC transporter permease [Cohnella abietis]|uniref:Putative transmembrane protein YxlG n=1 Tax=Cohnella abietis TaxID=2507935 RepID=A0A3T1DBB6_9BACL|nr:ABC transporter permease subunit [Cohnella abietis]BBI35255.1 putative transmembrane protein YxlG [Cohnella abietis]
MNGFRILLHKEWREAVRTAKLIWLPAVFVLLGLLQPISAKFMPEIIASAGNLPEGAIIQLPIPKPGEVLGQALGNFGLIGLLAICLAFMGTISSERRSGTAAWILVKPVSPFAYVASKWVMLIITVGLSFGLGYGGAWYYTNLLIGYPNVGDALFSALLYYCWLVFVGTIAIAASAWLRSPAAAAFVAIGSATLMQLIRGLFERDLSWLPSGLGMEAVSRLTMGDFSSWIGSALTAAASIILLMIVAVRGLRRSIE